VEEDTIDMGPMVDHVKKKKMTRQVEFQEDEGLEDDMWPKARTNYRRWRKAF